MDGKLAKKLLSEGVQGINEWNRRKSESDDVAGVTRSRLVIKGLSHDGDMRSVDLSGVSIYDGRLSSGQMNSANLEHAYLEGVRFIGADLSNGNFAKARLHECDFRDADLAGVDFEGAELAAVDFRGADLSRVNFGAAKLKNVDFRGAFLSEASFDSAELQDVQIEGADFSGANLRFSKISKGISIHNNGSETFSFKGVELSGADFQGVDLRRVDFSGASLTSAIFREAKLADASFRNTNLKEADFTGADLYGVNLCSACVEGATFEGANLVRARLSTNQLVFEITNEQREGLCLFDDPLFMKDQSNGLYVWLTKVFGSSTETREFGTFRSSVTSGFSRSAHFYVRNRPGQKQFIHHEKIKGRNSDTINSELLSVGFMEEIRQRIESSDDSVSLRVDQEDYLVIPSDWFREPFEPKHIEVFRRVGLTETRVWIAGLAVGAFLIALLGLGLIHSTFNSAWIFGSLAASGICGWGAYYFALRFLHLKDPNERFSVGDEVPNTGEVTVLVKPCLLDGVDLKEELIHLTLIQDLTVIDGRYRFSNMITTKSVHLDGSESTYTDFYSNSISRADINGYVRRFIGQSVVLASPYTVRKL